MNGDGTVILAAAHGKRLWLSTDTGSNWSEIRPEGDADKNWRCTGLNNAGTISFAGINSGRLYYIASQYSNKINNIRPYKINGIAVANISKVNGI
jgi:hypothetical protein